MALLFKVMVKKKTGKAIVRPGSLEFKKSDKLKIKNQTGGKIIVRLPGGVFGTGADPDDEIILPIDDDDTEEFDIHDDAEIGAYDFSVFCEKTFSFAQGNSDPEFIIEP